MCCGIKGHKIRIAHKQFFASKEKLSPKNSNFARNFKAVSPGRRPGYRGAWVKISRSASQDTAKHAPKYREARTGMPNRVTD